MEQSIALHGPARLRGDRDPAEFGLAFVNSYDPVRAVPDLFANPEHARVFLSEWCELDWDLDWSRLARSLQLYRDDLRAMLRQFVAGEMTIIDFSTYLDHKLAHWPWIARPVQDGNSFRVLFVPSPQLKAAQHIEAVVTRGLADLVAALGPRRLRQCEAPPCQEFFADHSKSGRQRFCGKRCATRYNVALFRKRHAS